MVTSETGWEARKRFEGIAGHGADVGDGEEWFGSVLMELLEMEGGNGQAGGS